MSDVADWLGRHRDGQFVQLEMPPAVAFAVTRVLQESGFEVHPLPAPLARAIVLPTPHLVDALLQAVVEAVGESGGSLGDCPKCSVGQHENCAGDMWDDRPGHDELATCPCYARGHRGVVERSIEEVLEMDVWPSAEDLEKLTGFRRHPITDFPPDVDLP